MTPPTPQVVDETMLTALRKYTGPGPMVVATRYDFRAGWRAALAENESTNRDLLNALERVAGLVAEQFALGAQADQDVPKDPDHPLRQLWEVSTEALGRARGGGGANE